MQISDALKILKGTDRVGVNIIKSNDLETLKYNNESINALMLAINELELLQSIINTVDAWAEKDYPFSNNHMCEIKNNIEKFREAYIGVKEDNREVEE